MHNFPGISQISLAINSGVGIYPGCPRPSRTSGCSRTQRRWLSWCSCKFFFLSSVFSFTLFLHFSPSYSLSFIPLPSVPSVCFPSILLASFYTKKVITLSLLLSSQGPRGLPGPPGPMGLRGVGDTGAKV